MNRRLIVVGDGPGRAALEARATPNIEFVGRIDDEALARFYRRARALIYPQREDFGLVAVEAQAAGRPVIAFGKGGVLDTVRPLFDDSWIETDRNENHPIEPDKDMPFGSSNPTGLFFHEPTIDALSVAIERFEKAEARFEAAPIRRWAERFSPSRFDQAFDREIQAAIETIP